MKFTDKTKDLIDKDKRYVSPSYTRLYPFITEGGHGMEVIDVEDNKYLDFTAGIATVTTGHCNREVVRAIQHQAEKLIHMSGTDFYYKPQIDLAERLAKIVEHRDPLHIYKVYFGNSGAEAIEAALKLARWSNAGHPHVLAFHGAFHGRTLGALSLTCSKSIQKRGFDPLPGGVIHVPYAHCYHCPFNCKEQECTSADTYQCLEYIKEYVFKGQVHPGHIAAMFVEPIQGEGGYVVPPKGWMKQLRELAAKNRIYFVADEIQTGMGRTGRFFAWEWFDIVPNIITMAKGLASGMPLGAMIAPAHLMYWPPGSHASTFGGNPVSCAAALKTIDLVLNGLIKNAGDMGIVLNIRLGKLHSTYELIGDVRGLGLMQAIELVKDRETKKPATRLRDRILKTCFKKGLLLLPCGESSIRFCPALTVSREDIHRMIEILESSIKEVQDGSS